ncbi:MAG: hypothetical protein Q8P15_02335 [Nanoarchaeota archaeon]|nr:hypothetical protein [Nanoarchaeota archaeon]
MTRKKNQESELGRIVNIVLAPIDDNSTEVYIATKDEKYGYFRIGGNPADNFRFKEINVLEYIQQTQQMIDDPNIKTQLGSKN